MTIRKWFALLALFPVLVFLAESVSSAPETRPAHWIARTLFAAGGFYQPYNVLDYGATGDSTTNDAPAINAMLDIVCASSGPRKVYFPAGDYRVGLAGTNKTYSGVQVECGDIEIYGDGPDTRILNGADNGGFGMFICSSIADGAKTCGTILNNIIVRDLRFEDDDPVEHGHKFIYVDEGSLAGGTPAWGDAVTWTGGTGTVQYYESGFIGVVLATGALTPPEDITDSTWTATGAGQVLNEVVTTEESHGLGFEDITNILIDRVSFRSISDESLVIGGGTRAVMLRDIDARDCSQMNASGSCINWTDGSSGSMQGGYFHGGRASIGGGGAIIAIATEKPSGGVGIDGISLTDVFIEEDCDGSAQEDCIEGGLQLQLGFETIFGIDITNAKLFLDNVYSNPIVIGGSELGSLKFTGGTIRGTFDVGANLHTSFVNVDASTTQTTAYIAQGVDAITGGYWHAGNNVTSALVHLSVPRAVITGATFEGGLGDCIRLGDSGDGATVTGNLCITCGGGSGDHCTQAVGGSDWNLVTGNFFVNNAANTGFTAGDDDPIGARPAFGSGCISIDTGGLNSLCAWNLVEN